MSDLCSVSVILPFYNAGGTIDRALSSVYAQELLPIEVIVVDDCSDTHNAVKLAASVEEFQKLNKSIKLRVLSLDENKGAGFARNLAIKHSSGKYMAFLDSDDVWNEAKLAVQFPIMESNALTLSAHGYLPNLNLSDYPEGGGGLGKVYRWQFIFHNPFFTPTVMVLRSGFKNFDMKFRRCDDYKCWLENFNASNRYIDLTLAAGFKSPLGSSGLTGSLELMHSAYVEVLKALLRERAVSYGFYLLARGVEFIKYPVRIFRYTKVFNF